MFAKKYSIIPWQDIYLMRNRVSHDYFSVDLHIVWNTIQNDLPELKKQFEYIYQQLEHEQL